MILLYCIGAVKMMFHFSALEHRHDAGIDDRCYFLNIIHFSNIRQACS